MKTLNIYISENEYNQFGLKSENLSFSEFLDIVSKKLQKNSLRKSVELAEKYSLSTLSMDEITDEVKAVRNAKNSN